jgi:penicillin-binding protein 1A
MATMLADVINAGTGARARGLGFTLPAAGKTGTTNEFRDAWFVGFTPSLVAGVWVGFDQPHTILPNGFAGDVAVPLWASFMKTATRGAKAEWLRPPKGVTTASVCRISGKLATSGCEHVDVVDDSGRQERRSMVYTEYFVEGTEPTTSCDLHQPRSLFGAIASVFSKTEEPAPLRIEDTGLPPLPPPRAVTATTADAPTVPPDAPEEPVKKKRGFWSKLFGLGK